MRALLPFFLLFNACSAAHKALEAQLYEDLLYSYNKIPRPVFNSSEVLMVDMGAALIRIIDVDEKNQVLTTNLWLEMKWIDVKLRWNPARYGGIKTLHIPSDLIWTPDLVLYNNAAGDPDITIFTDALVAYDGRVFWSPPAIYKSFCPIDVRHFPYDRQRCEMKFGAWSYTGFYVDLRQIKPKESEDSDGEFMENGMDLSFFYKSAEWDLLSLTSARHSVLYASCCGPEKYVDITFYFDLRRKTLFYTSNLIIPCFLISFLTTFVFYLSHHKITFSISILVTLTVFFLVLIDIIPPTSLVIPMFGRYLITTMVLVSLSTIVSVVTVNFRFRSGTAQQMTPRMRSIFLNCLPKLLFMKRPEQTERLKKHRQSAANLNKPPLRPSAEMFAGAANLLNNWQQSRLDEPSKRDHAANCTKPKGRHRVDEFERDRRPHAFEIPLAEINAKRPKFQPPMYASLHVPNHAERTGITDLGVNYAAGVPHGSNSLPFPTKNLREEARETKEKINDLILGKLLQQVKLISEHFRRQEEEMEISDDWRFVAMVLDRLFLIIFSILNFGTFLILLEAPTLHEHIEPMNITFPTKPLGQANIYSMTGN
ncbi:hypothetical protein M3Y99_00891800 [Aphelenchoides fujianensis]|nr:hypothetical protein M3Y99_00891800 [Aphelenchoides fujianensis]